MFVKTYTDAETGEIIDEFVYDDEDLEAETTPADAEPLTKVLVTEQLAKIMNDYSSDINTLIAWTQVQYEGMGTYEFIDGTYHAYSPHDLMLKRKLGVYEYLGRYTDLQSIRDKYQRDMVSPQEVYRYLEEKVNYMLENEEPTNIEIDQR